MVNDLEKLDMIVDDPCTEPFIELYYQLFCLDYTAGIAIDDLKPSMELLIKSIIRTTDFVERNYPNRNDDDFDDDDDETLEFSRVLILQSQNPTEELTNFIGLGILFGQQDWFDAIVNGVDLTIYWREKAIDSLIALKRPDYPIVNDKTSRELSFRNSLYKAIHAKTEKETLAFLDKYLRLWYDGLRKAGYSIIDSHLNQQGRLSSGSPFYGYWCFDAAAVAYLKNIDNSSLHRFMYYPKDIVAYSRKNNVENKS